MQTGRELVRVSAAPHPLRAARVDLELTQGLTLREILEAAQPDPVLHRWAHVEIDGVPMPPERWHLIRPKAGHLVTIRTRPTGGGGGGGKSPVLTVITIAVVVAAIAVTGGALAPAFGAAFAAGGIGALAAGAAIGLAGAAISFAFMPSPKAGNFNAASGVRDVRDSPTAFIEGARNQMNLWGRVPDVLGRHRMVPYYGAAPYTVLAGKDQYLHLLFVWTPGNAEIVDSSFRIGNTPLSRFDDVQIETRLGQPGVDTPVSIYLRDVVEETFALTLKQPDSYQRRTTATEADLITVDLTWPQGLARFDDLGVRQSHAVVLRLRYKLVGEATWRAPVFDSETVPNTWYTVVTGQHTEITITGKQTSALRHGFRWPTPVRGQYDVEFRRMSADTTSDKIFDVVQWTALRRFIRRDPISFPTNLPRTGLRIRATDQLNRVVDTFSGIVQRVAPSWDRGAGAWVTKTTSNPAAMFRHVLQGPSNARPVPTSQLNLESLQEWAEYCGERDYQCNMIIDYPTSVRETLNMVCGTGRASLDNIDGKWGVVIDRSRAVAVQHFTPRNSRGFRAQKLWLDKPHAVHVRFNDAAHDWRSAERIVYDEGFTAANATKYEQIDLTGVTGAQVAGNLIRHQLRAAALQPESWEMEVDFEHLVANRGDMVLITHDVLLVGQASGRVKSRILDGGNNITGVVIDGAVMMGAGLLYGITFRTVAHGAITTGVVTNPGEHTTLTLTPPLSSGNHFATGDLFAFGQRGFETVQGQIKSIRRGTDLTARLTLRPYSDVLFDWAEPPDFDPGMTPLFDTPAPQITTVYTGGAALGREVDATLVRVVVEVVPLGRLDARLDAHARPSETGEPFREAEVVAQPDQGIIVLGGMQSGEYWDIRVRWVVGALLPGPWATRSSVFVSGYEQASGGGLPSLQNLTLSAIGGQALLRWDPPAAADARFGGSVHFRHSPFQVGATWANSTSIGRALPAGTLVANLPLKGGTYLARVFDRGGNAGGISVVSTKQASFNTFNILLSFSEDPDWAGPHTGTEVGPGGVLQLDGTRTAPIGGFGDLGEVAITGFYDFSTVVDLLTVKRVRVTTHLNSASANTGETIDDRTSPIDTWTDFDGGADQGDADAQVWVRITDDPPGAATSVWADGTGFSDGTGWTDMSVGGPTWKLYQRLDSAEFEARGYDFQVRLASRDPAFNILISELRIDFEELA